MMKLSQACAAANGELIGRDLEFKEISTDSRHIPKGALFIALKGGNFDGHGFIAQVEELGASAVVVDHKIDGCTLPQLIVTDTTQALGAISSEIRKAFSGSLVAITGSCGKTSVKGLLRSIFAQAGSTLATKGNFNNHIGVPLTLNALTEHHEYAVIEMGASGLGEIRYLVGLANPDIALVNNVRAAHVSGFGSIEAIAQEKGEIYNGLGQQGCAVINLDDPFAERYLEQTQHNQQLAFTLDSSTALTASVPVIYAADISLNAIGQASFILHSSDSQAAISLQVLGEHFVQNALAAASCAIAAGINIELIASGLEAYVGEKGRMQAVAPVVFEQQMKIINDAYNANPGSVRAAIDFLSASKQQGHQAILVLGDMGELGEGEVAEHTAIGFYAAEKGLDGVIATGSLAAYAAEVFDGGIVTQTLEEAADAIASKIFEPITVVLKGSRSSGVDRIVDYLPDAIHRHLEKGHGPC